MEVYAPFLTIMLNKISMSVCESLKHVKHGQIKLIKLVQYSQTQNKRRQETLNVYVTYNCKYLFCET
jgi:hypothetical protein